MMILKDGTQLKLGNNGEWHLFAPPIDTRFNSPDPCVNRALAHLANGGLSQESLKQCVQEDDGPLGSTKLFYYLENLQNSRLIWHRIYEDNRPLATLIPLSGDFRFEPGEISQETAFVLTSVFCIRKTDEGLIIESPTAKAYLRLDDAGLMNVLSLFEKPVTVSGISFSLKLIQFLLGVHALRPVHEPEPLPETWEFHDALMHARCRFGRQPKGYGGTYRYKGKLEHLPVIKPKMSEQRIPLYKPDLESLRQKDSSFTDVLERRKSIREQGNIILTANQLGEFLYRALRIKQVFKGQEYDACLHNYTSGGAINEIEVYPFIHACEGISSGVYHYDALGHELESLSPINAAVETIFKGAQRATMMKTLPQVVIVLACRFQRLMWKYESMAYSVILKNVGAIYQTLYMVATAMNLSPCGVGGGSSDEFCKVIGTNYWEETSVGEFVLGSQP